MQESHWVSKEPEHEAHLLLQVVHVLFEAFSNVAAVEQVVTHYWDSKYFPDEQEVHILLPVVLQSLH